MTSGAADLLPMQRRRHAILAGEGRREEHDLVGAVAAVEYLGGDVSRTAHRREEFIAAKAEGLAAAVARRQDARDQLAGRDPRRAGED